MTVTNRNTTSDHPMTRRMALSMLGATGIALAGGAKAGLAQNANLLAAEVKQRFSTVAAMKKDASLQAGMIVQTVGFHSLEDGGGAFYLIVTPTAEDKANEGDVIAVSNALHATLLEGRAVNYAMFGAVSDGKNDDGVQIKVAHEYAVAHQLPIINLTGEYWISKSNNIPITTDVSWGKSTFHLNEQYNEKSIPRFKVLNDEERQDIVFDDATKAKFLEQLKPGVTIIPELAPYTNCLIQIKDDKDKVGFRKGGSYKGQSWSREELFYVEEGGSIIGDIAWAFKDYTTLNATFCNNNYLVIEGGGFYVSGDNPGTKYTGYYHCGFSVQRSRTIIRDQWMGLEKDARDISMEPRRGFYVLSHVYDVLLENIRLIPWEQNREGTDRDVGAGTYGLGGGRMLNCTFRNVTAEGTLVHWGVFGTNLNKNFRIEQCQLNRIDVHFHCWNLYIRDSVIGLRGISITGGGNLWIENTVRLGNQFINFRYDFGAVWKGDIRISNCRLMPHSKGEVSVLRHVIADFHFGYDLGPAHTVKVEDLIIDYSNAPDSDNSCWMQTVLPFSKTESGLRLFYPYNLVFRNVRVSGRTKGVRLIKLPQPYSFDMGRAGSYDGIQLQPNGILVFDNIQLEKIAAGPALSADNTHLQLGDGAAATYEDEKALYAKIHFSNCENVCAYFINSIAAVTFERCSIDRIAADNGKPFKGQLTFNDCVFSPHVTGDDNALYALDSELGTAFTNCTVHAPFVDGNAKPEQVDHFGFITLNKSVRHYHLNTKLGNDILRYVKEKNIKLSPQFIGMLKAHHTLEEENVTEG